jgi:hypothetical protein
MVSQTDEEKKSTQTNKKQDKEVKKNLTETKKR